MLNQFASELMVSNGMYCFDTSLLNVKVRNFVNGLTLGIKVYLLKKNGEVLPVKIDNVVPATDGTETLVQPFSLTEGTLIACDVAVMGTTLVREGDCYVSINVQLERANIEASAIVVNLASGYVTNTKSIAFPSSGVQGMTDTIGKSTIETLANPAAGAQFTYTVPNHRRFRIEHISFELTTSAAVGNRNGILNITENGGANGIFILSSTNVPASNVGFYTYSLRGDAEKTITQGTNIFVNVPFAPIELHAGDTVKSLIANIGVADQIGRVRLYGKLWIDVGTAAGGAGGGGGAT